MMREERKKENRKERSPQSRRHPIRQQLAGGLLCICLVAASMPLEYYGFPAMKAQAEEGLGENAQLPDTDAPDTLGEFPAGEGTEETPEVAGEDPTEGGTPGTPGDQEDPADKDATETPETTGEEGQDPTDQDATETPETTGEEGQHPIEQEKNPAEQEKDPADGETIEIPVSGDSTDAPDDKKPGTAEADVTITPDDAAAPGGDKTDASGTGNPDGDQLDVSLDGTAQTPGGDGAGASGSTDNAPETPAENGTPSTKADGDASYEVIFYSGKAGQGNKLAVTTGSTFPALNPMEEEGWTAVGWVTDSHGSSSGKIYKPGDPIPAGSQSYYYGIYEKPVTITYNGIITRSADDTVQTEQKTKKAIVHAGGIGYRYAEFKAKSQAGTAEYTFLGWDKNPDSAAAEYTVGSTISTGSDLVLYAIYGKNTEISFYDGDGTSKTVTAYINTKSNQGVVRAPELMPMAGWRALGWATGTNEYDKFYTAGQEIPISESTECYSVYEQDVTISYDVNTENGPEAPGEMTSARRANVHGDVTYRDAQFLLPSLPENAGYTFVDWNTQPDGEGTTCKGYGSFAADTILYAQWEDQTPPVLGEASYGPGYQGFFHWIIRKKGLTVTIPVSDEGSGVDQAFYTLLPENGTAKKGTAQLSEAEGGQATNVRVLRQYNQMVIQFTIDEDFKGAVLVSSTDKAGNASAEKRLTAEGGGVIVEDNAPEITFAAVSDKTANGTASIDVTVTDAAGERISGGLAGISYQIDENGQVDLPRETFNGGIVETHTFTAQISGEGRHTLWVSAVDNAGNESSRRVTVNLTRPQVPDDGNNGDNGNDNNGNNNGNNTGNGDSNTGNGNTGNGNNGSGSDGNGSGNNGSGSNGSGTSGSGSNGSGTGGSGTGGSGNNGSGGSGTGGSGSNGTGSGTGGTGNNGTGSGTPKTGEFPHIEIYATLAMIAGFSYLLLYFETGKNGMTEEKKEELVSGLIRWAKKGFFHKLLALAAIFLLLTYYHSIGKRTEYGLSETLREVSRG